MAIIRNTVNGGGESANSPVKQRMAQNMRRAIREGQQEVAATRMPRPAVPKPRKEIMQRVGTSTPPPPPATSPAPRPTSQSITHSSRGSSKPATPSGGGTSQSITQRRGRG